MAHLASTRATASGEDIGAGHQQRASYESLAGNNAPLAAMLEELVDEIQPPIGTRGEPRPLPQQPVRILSTAGSVEAPSLLDSGERGVVMTTANAIALGYLFMGVFNAAWAYSVVQRIFDSPRPGLQTDVVRFISKDPGLRFRAASFVALAMLVVVLLWPAFVVWAFVNMGKSK